MGNKSKINKKAIQQITNNLVTGIIQRHPDATNQDVENIASDISSIIGENYGKGADVAIVRNEGNKQRLDIYTFRPQSDDSKSD